MATQYRALEAVSRGLYPSVLPGEIIPPVFLNMLGEEEPIDFERLVELGIAEPVSSPSGKAAAKDDPKPAPSAAKSSSHRKPAAKSSS